MNDSVWTAAARHADLVFPSALAIERDDVAAASRDDWIIRSRKVLEPPEGIETDHAVLARIAARLRLDDAFTCGRSEEEWLRYLYDGYRAAHPGLPDWETFCETGHARLEAPAPGELHQPFRDFLSDPAAHPLSTPSGLVELMPPLLEQTDARLGAPLNHVRPSDREEDPTFPLRLLSPQPEVRLHSQLDGASAAASARRKGCEVARLHPDALSEAGVQDGARALLTNDRGSVLVVVQADGRVAPGHVVLPTGGWYAPGEIDGRRVDLGGNPNTLTRDTGASDLSQGASAGGARVRLEPLPVGATIRPFSQAVASPCPQTGFA